MLLMGPCVLTFEAYFLNFPKFIRMSITYFVHGISLAVKHVLFNKLMLFHINICFFSCRYQQILHRNLVYLATIADSNQQGMQNLLGVSKVHVHWARFVRRKIMPLGIHLSPLWHQVTHTTAIRSSVVY